MNNLILFEQSGDQWLGCLLLSTTNTTKILCVSRASLLWLHSDSRFTNLDSRCSAYLLWER